MEKVEDAEVVTNVEPSERALSPKMVEKIQAIDEEFRKVQANLNSQLQIMLECYVEALNLSENQYWTLSQDRKSILIHEKKS